VGGGLGGAALAKSMAEHGARVLVVEREKRFKDRIRGEFLAPWGAADAQALGIYELLRSTCARECPKLGLYTEPGFGEPRDLVTTTPHKLPELSPFIIRQCRKCFCTLPQRRARMSAEAHVREVIIGREMCLQ
jgi:2-polyprenyl-6-methoxyphenol hydroxylase-like FAD-dependent oxidoreductase